jgi:tRNA1(Val) A37 N6-methylase TrmN6
MKIKDLYKLIDVFDIDDIEKNLMYLFLRKNNIDYSNNSILAIYFKDFSENDVILRLLDCFEINSIKELVAVFELLIPKGDKKLNGAFFTPDYIVEYIISEINPKETDKTLDPSCGSGAFLLGLMEYYSNKNCNLREIIKHNIFGIDILEYNIRRARLIIVTYALMKGFNIIDTDLNLFQLDTLRNVDFVKELKINNIVGNPPYVKYQDLDDSNRTYLKNNFNTLNIGTFNLYFAFFEVGFNVLPDEGKLGFITPNNYFTSLAGRNLRQFFRVKKAVSKIVDFRHKKIFDAQTYTAITFLDKKNKDSILFDHINQEQEPVDFLRSSSLSKNYYLHLQDRKWRLLRTKDQQNIRKIESIGTPIGDIFDIAVGIATLKDELYFLDSRVELDGYYIKEYNGGRYKIEKEITKDIFKISDFKSIEEISKNTRKIIFPYEVVNNKAIIIPIDRLKKEYPQCYDYFIKIEESLLKRDKGKRKIKPFYAYGRSQGLNRFGKKILTPTFSKFPRFMLCPSSSALFCNGYGLYFRDNNAINEIFGNIWTFENADVILKIINSNVMHYFVSKTSVGIEGGYPCYQKNFIERFNIPEFTLKEINELRNINDKQLIDEWLVSKYQLILPEPNLF